jgi:hypothetical protein
MFTNWDKPAVPEAKVFAAEVQGALAANYVGMRFAIIDVAGLVYF